MTAATQHRRSGTVLEIYAAGQTEPGSIYDFEEIGFSRKVGKALLRAFVALQGANTLESQRAAWILIKRFGSFANEKFGRPERLPPECLEEFGVWLSAAGLSDKTVGATINSAIRTLRWCLRNTPGAVHPRLELKRLPHAAQSKTKPQRGEVIPDEELIRKVLAACYAEIEQVENRLREFRELPLLPEPNELADLLLRLLQHGNGVLPSQKRLIAVHGGATILRRLQPYGGLRGVCRQYYVSIDDVFPFYLAVLVQASGNPQSLHKADQNCIAAVPLRPDLERVIWDKERARREQAPDFPKDKQWAAPNIVRRLRLLNAELRPMAPSRFADALFLCRNLHGQIAPPSWQAVHNRFREFRSRYALPKIDLRSFRVAGAKLHHRAARSLAAPRQRLQHSSEVTTQKYTPLTDNRAVHDQVILRFQGLLISEAERRSSVQVQVVRQSTSAVAAETLFGFGCADPLGGITPGSKQGEICLHFHQCATCPGAMIAVDDPTCVSKLLEAHDHLLRERDRAIREGWSRRFETLYGPTLTILMQDVLPGVSAGTVEKARAVARLRLPKLE